MAITYVGNKTGWANATTSYVVGLTSLVSGTNSAPTVSDVVIINAGWTSTSNGAPTITTAGYIGLVADQYANDTRDANAAFAYKVMGASPDTSVTIAAANNATFGSAAAIYVFRGISAATPFIPLSLASVAINISNPRSRAITPEKSGQVVVSGGFATADNSPVAKSGPSLWVNVVNSLGSGATMSGIAMFASYTSTISGTAVQAPIWYGGETSTSDSAIGFVAALNPSLPPTVALNTPADTATGQSTTPTLNFTGTDADSDAVEYEVQVDTQNDFNSGGDGPLIDALSTTDAGFTAGHPFASGAAKDYTVQSALSNSTTYYWRVRAIDPTGTNTWGAWATTRSFDTRPKSAALTGTATASIAETDIVTGGKTIIITLTDDTWVTAGATFDGQRANIIAGLTSAQSELLGWNNVVKVLQGVAGVVRTSATVVTITLDAQITYNITATETITVTVPSTALTGAGALVATPTFTVSATGGVQTAAATGFMTTNTGFWGS